MDFEMHRGAEQALVLLQRLADHHGVRVDRAVLSQWLPSEPPRTQEDLLAWLVACGSRVGIRVGYADCDYADLIAFARQGVPVAFRVVNERSRDGRTFGDWESIDGGHWLMSTSLGWTGRVRLEEVGDVENVRWARKREVRKLSGLNRAKRIRCLVAQPLAAEAVVAGDVNHSKKPVVRLMRLFRPDLGDMWAIIIFSLVVGVLTLAAPLAVEALVNTVAFGRYVQPVLVLAFMLFICLGFAASLRLLLTIIAEVLQRRLFVRVAEDLGHRLPRAALPATDGKYAPELVNRFLDVANIQKSSASLLLDGIALLVSAAVGMAVLGFYHTFLLGFDIIMLGMMAFTIFVLGRGAVASSKKESKAKYQLTAWLEDLVRCPTAFSLHGGQRFALERTDRLAVSYLDYRRIHFRVLLRQVSFALFMYAVSLTALLGLGGWLVIIGELTLGQLVAAELIVGVVVGAFTKMGKHMESYYDMLASVDKVGELLDLPTEPLGGPLQVDGLEAVRLCLRDVVVEAGGRTAVSGVSCEVPGGRFAAIVGPPGSGKSVLFDALTARRDLAAGEVVIDGNPLSQLDSESLRFQIGLARDIEVFEGTVAENVHLYRPNIRMKDVREALDMVGLSADVRGFEHGLDTPLTSGGAPFSRDQALRLMIARAIVGRPRLLLIDGTLDALADVTRDYVLSRLTSQQPSPWTMLVATGRQAIETRADIVCRLGGDPASATSDGGSGSARGGE